MGWYGSRAEYYKNGKIDRKREMDEGFSERYEVVKSSMVGSTYYAAIRHPKGYVFGYVARTTICKDEFTYKPMDETMGPCYYDCPLSILKLLSPVEECELGEQSAQWAQAWREKCMQTHRDKQNPLSFAKLKEGTRIKYITKEEMKFSSGGIIPANTELELVKYRRWNKGKFFWRGYHSNIGYFKMSGHDVPIQDIKIIPEVA